MPSGQRFTISFHIYAALADNAVITWTAPHDCTLLHVSACASNDSACLMTIGDSADPDEYLTSSVIGDSGTPVEYDGDDFVDTAGNTHARYYPRIVDGTVVIITLDYDGDGGTAAEDVTIVLTLAEG
jgi:hypothetical protein